MKPPFSTYANERRYRNEPTYLHMSAVERQWPLLGKDTRIYVRQDGYFHVQGKRTQTRKVSRHTDGA